MAFSGGTYTLPAGNPVTAGNTIEASWANTTLNDIATALSTCVLKDGTQTLTANIPMGGFKLTGLAAGSSANDSVRMAQLQGGSVSYLTGTAGTNTVTALGTPTVTGLTTGQRFTFIPANTNTAATTLQVDSTSALSVFWNNAALVGGELRQSVPVTVLYDGTQYQLIASGAFANTFAIPDTMRLQAAGDRTKQIAFSATGISTATTRTLTMPDFDVNLGITGLAEDTAPDLNADYSATYDASAGGLKKVLLGRYGTGTLATAVAATAGVISIISNIPSWATEINAHGIGLSLNGSSNILFQLGVAASGVISTGYASAGLDLADASGVVGANSTGGIVLIMGSATRGYHGHVTFRKENSSNNTWTAAGFFARNDGAGGSLVGGSKSLTGAPDRVAIASANGTDILDNGEWNVSWR